MLRLGLPLFGYLVGSVSSAILVARLMGLPDPRTVGSRNPGATNVLRYGGRLAAALTLAGDVLKAVVPVAAARALTDDAWLLAATALAAFLGHLYPVFFGFRGGKGVATALGVWLALEPITALLLALTWLATAAVFRISSLAALVATLAAPFYVAWRLPQTAYLALALVMSALLVWRHRENIRRLVTGQESRIGR
jgi:glycerol-3-phosphate acyltransferase PlsY